MSWWVAAAAALVVVVPAASAQAAAPNAATGVEEALDAVFGVNQASTGCGVTAGTDRALSTF